MFDEAMWMTPHFSSREDQLARSKSPIIDEPVLLIHPNPLLNPLTYCVNNRDLSSMKT